MGILGSIATSSLSFLTARVKMSLALGSEPTCIGKETSDSSTEPETSESEQEDVGLEDVDSDSAVIYLETGCSESWNSHSHTTMSDSSDEDNIPLSYLVSNKSRKNDSENVSNNASSDEDNIPLSNLVSNKNRKSDSKNGSDNASSDEDNIPLSNLVSNKNRKMAATVTAQMKIIFRHQIFYRTETEKMTVVMVMFSEVDHASNYQ